MKKFVLILSLLSTVFLVAQQKRIVNVGILLDQQATELAPLLKELQVQIQTVVGEDALVRFPEKSLLINDYDTALAKAQYKTLLANETDIVLAFGIVNGLVLSQRTSYPKPTVLFGALNQDLHKIDISKRTSGIENFTYLVDSQSFLSDLKKFKELTNFKKVGIIMEKKIVDLLPITQLFASELEKLDAAYTLISYSRLQDIEDQLSDVDAVYLAGGFFLKREEVKSLATLFIDKKIPSFTINDLEYVRAGIMASNQSEDNLDQFFRRVAITIEQFIAGKPLAELPVYIDYNSRLTVNYTTAKAVGVPIKYSLINDTDFVGEEYDPNAEQTYTLQSVMDQVLTANLGLKATEKDVALSEQQVQTAKSNFLPSVSAAATGTYVDPRLAAISNGQSPEFSTAGNITLQQTVFSASAGANITVQEALKKAQTENYKTEVLNTVFNASNAYFNALILKANAQVRMRNLDLTKRNLQIATENFEAGEAGKSDVLRFRSELAQNTQAMIEAINQLEQGFVSLNQLLNNPIERAIDVEDAELDKGLYKDYNYQQLTELLDSPTTREPFIAFLIEEAKKNAPELKSLQFNLQATERNMRLSGSDRFLPTVALRGQYNHTFSRHGKGTTPLPGFSVLNSNYNVALNVSIPIFNRNQNTINLQTAKIQKEQIELNRANSELNIAANVRNGVLNLVNQVSNIELSKVSEQTAQEALELTQASYKEGAVTVIQLIDAQNNYINAQLAKANAVYNFLINALQLERNIGYFFLLHSPEENQNFTQRFKEYLLKK